MYTHVYVCIYIYKGLPAEDLLLQDAGAAAAVGPSMTYYNILNYVTMYYSMLYCNISYYTIMYCTVL